MMNQLTLHRLLRILICSGFSVAIAAEEPLRETLPPLVAGKVPQTVDELWAKFDPRAEALDIEVLHSWEEEQVVMKVLRYRVGVFKGEKAMVAAVFGYPKEGKNLPGLVQIHGGGQYADYKAVLTNAKRGYATVSISWAGRISAPGYRVSPAEVQLFWKEKKDDPAYKVTTDWGALDGYHAPSRNPKNVFPGIPTGEWTLDGEIASPRNNSWFLCTMAARRALTLLEQNPKVNPEKLGVYGHSMGGKLTVLTSGADDRVKAAAPSCGGISDRFNDDPLFRATIGDDAYLKRINCPIIFLSPANDFHGRIDDLQTAITEIYTSEWRVSCSPHHNHQDTAMYEVATQLWFDQHLKGKFVCPETPSVELSLETESGIPTFTVSPDTSKKIVSIDVFYTQQGQIDGEKDDRENTIARFWHHVPARMKNIDSIVEIPLRSTDAPLWIYANVTYALEDPVTGAGYYYGTYIADEFCLSSRMSMVTPADLEKAGVKATGGTSLIIESFGEDWEKEWFTYKEDHWARKTHKVYDPEWAAPEGANLVIEARSDQANQLVIGIDQFVAEVSLAGKNGNGPQTFELSPADFQNAERKSLESWAGIRELRFSDQETLRAKDAQNNRKVGGVWKGDAPVFKSIRWQK